MPTILVVGLGDFGATLGKELVGLGYQVLGIDIRDEPVRELADLLTKTVQGDATSQGLWRDLPLQEVGIGVIAFSADTTASMITALILKKMGIKRIIAKSKGELHTELLRTVGVDRVIEPNKESARRTVYILGSALEDYLEVTRELGVARIKAPEGMKGIPLRALYETYRTTVVILSRGDRIILQPPDTEAIRAGDTLVVAGRSQDLQALAEASRSGQKR